MVVEFLDEAQEWPITLPPEPERDRPIEARDEARVCDRWEFVDGDWKSTNPVGKRYYWSEIVSLCLYRGWALVSLPKTGDGE